MIDVSEQTCALAVRPSEQIPLIELPGFALEGYVQMVRLIDACCEVDAVKAIRDKIEALRVYAHQGQNYESELKLAAIRLRAEHRAGVLLREMLAAGERVGRGGDRKSKFPDGTLKLENLGIAKKQSSLWQQFAQIAWGAIEHRLGEEQKPMTVSQLLREREPVNGLTREVRAFAWIAHLKVDPQSERARLIREFPPSGLPPVVSTPKDYQITRHKYHECAACGFEWAHGPRCRRCGTVLLTSAILAITDYLECAAELIAPYHVKDIVTVMDSERIRRVPVPILRKFLDHVEAEIRLRGSKDGEVVTGALARDAGVSELR